MKKQAPWKGLRWKEASVHEIGYCCFILSGLAVVVTILLGLIAIRWLFI